MFRKGVIVSLSIIFVFLGVTVRAQERTPNRIMTATLIDRVKFSSWVKRSFRISPDSKHEAYVAKAGDKMVVVVDGKGEKPCDEILSGTPIFSPNSLIVAYAARDGNQWFVVADGREGKRYDGIVKGILTFSPNSQHLAYVAKSGNSWFVVLDGKEGVKYGSDASIVDGSIIIDSSESLHYLFVQDCYVYHAEETID